MNRLYQWLCVASVCCLALGCADQGLKPVTGMVTMDGQPASGVKLVFVPTEGGRANSMASTDTQGHYSLSYTSQYNGTLPGDYKVLIMKEESDTGRQLIPPRYSSGKSTMQASVTEDGDNVFNFEIESK